MKSSSAYSIFLAGTAIASPLNPLFVREECAEGFNTDISWQSVDVQFGTSRPSDLIRDVLREKCTMKHCDESVKEVPVQFVSQTGADFSQGNMKIKVEGDWGDDCLSINDQSVADEQGGYFIDQLVHLFAQNEKKDTIKQCEPTTGAGSQYGLYGKCQDVDNYKTIKSVRVERKKGIDGGNVINGGSMQVSLEFEKEEMSDCEAILKIMSVAAAPAGPVGGGMSAFFGNFNAGLC